MPTVLLVDDEPVLRRVLEVNLRAAGIDVASASSGSSALEAVRDACPDAIVLDIGLPDMDGWQLLERLAEIVDLGSVAVIVLSGAALRPGADGPDGRGYAADVQALLTKPVEPTELVETVRRLTRRDA